MAALLLAVTSASAVVVASATGSSAWGATEEEVLGPGTHCVAYVAQKVKFMVISGNDPIVGKNCDVEAQVLPDLGGLYHIEVVVPIQGFKSGDSERDEDVRKALKMDVQPDITFRTKPMAPDKWRELLSKHTFDIAGDLVIGQKSYPINLSSKYVEGSDSAEIDGSTKVRFSDFDVIPPKVIGGIVAKTKPEFELRFHLLASRILGADSIQPHKATSSEVKNEPPSQSSRDPSRRE